MLAFVIAIKCKWPPYRAATIAWVATNMKVLAANIAKKSIVDNNSSAKRK